MPTPHLVRACLITNPNSGRGGIDLSTVKPTLAAHGWDVQLRRVAGVRGLADLDAAAVAGGVDVVVACGGDGTLGETVDGVIGSDAAVGVLPGAPPTCGRRRSASRTTWPRTPFVGLRSSCATPSPELCSVATDSVANASSGRSGPTVPIDTTWDADTVAPQDAPRFTSAWGCLSVAVVDLRCTC